MTPQEAFARAGEVILAEATTAKHTRFWNALEDELKALPFNQFVAIYDAAKVTETMAAFALICMMEG